MPNKQSHKASKQQDDILWWAKAATWVRRAKLGIADLSHWNLTISLANHLAYDLSENLAYNWVGNDHYYQNQYPSVVIADAGLNYDVLTMAYSNGFDDLNCD